MKHRQPPSPYLVGILLALCAGLSGQGEPPEAAPPPPQGEAARDPQGKAGEIPIPIDREAGQRIDLRLDEALRLGARNNTGLRAGELAPRQAEQDLRSSQAIFEPELYGDLRVAKSQDPSRNVFSPEITRKSLSGTLGVRQLVPTGGLFDASYTPTRTEQTTTIAGFPSPQFSSALTLSYTQPLLRGAWTDYTRSDIDIRRSTLAAAESRFGRTAQDVLQAVVDGYWELVFARENYRVVVQGLELALAQEARTRERIRVGDLAALDIVADQAEVARRREELVIAENDIRRREDDLRRLLYDDSDGRLWVRHLVPVTPIGEFPTEVPLDWREVARRAARERADLRALRAEVGIAETQLLVAERDVLPRLDVVTSYTTDSVGGRFRDAWNDTTDLEYPDWSVRLELSVPIGNNSALAGRDRARLEVERRRRLLYDAELNVFLAVRDAVRQMRQLAESIQRSRESVRLEQTNLEREVAKRDVGASTTFDVQQVNQTLLEARQRLLRNQLDYRKAESNLEYVQGTLRAPDAAAGGEGPKRP